MPLKSDGRSDASVQLFHFTLSYVPPTCADTPLNPVLFYPAFSVLAFELVWFPQLLIALVDVLSVGSFPSRAQNSLNNSFTRPAFDCYNSHDFLRASFVMQLRQLLPKYHLSSFAFITFTHASSFLFICLHSESYIAVGRIAVR